MTGSKVVFYRGIVIDDGQVEGVKRRIIGSGIGAQDRIEVRDLRPHLDALLADPALWGRDPGFGVVDSGADFVCGDEGGATYYACDRVGTGPRLGL